MAKKESTPQLLTCPENQPHAIREAGAIFFIQQSPRKLLWFIIYLAVSRLLLGDIGLRDIILGTELILLTPFAEVLFHVIVLHHRGNSSAARHHRLHHLQPNQLGPILIPLSLYGWLPYVIALVSFAILRDLRLTFTAMTLIAIGVLLYEWCHYIIHTPTIKLKNGYARMLRRNHLSHHNTDENDHWEVMGPGLVDFLIRLVRQMIRNWRFSDPITLSPKKTGTARTMGCKIDEAGRIVD